MRPPAHSIHASPPHQHHAREPGADRQHGEDFADTHAAIRGLVNATVLGVLLWVVISTVVRAL